MEIPPLSRLFHNLDHYNHFFVTVKFFPAKQIAIKQKGEAASMTPRSVKGKIN